MTILRAKNNSKNPHLARKTNHHLASLVVGPVGARGVNVPRPVAVVLKKDQENARVATGPKATIVKAIRYRPNRVEKKNARQSVFGLDGARGANALLSAVKPELLNVLENVGATITLPTVVKGMLKKRKTATVMNARRFVTGRAGAVGASVANRVVRATIFRFKSERESVSARKAMI